MWFRPDKPVPIHPSQLRIGIFVWIDLPWSDHPFVYNKFRITTQQQLDEITALGLEHIHYFPNKSTVEPGPQQAEPAAPAVEPEPTPAPAAAERQNEQRAAKDMKLRQQREAAARAERGWERAARGTREALLGLNYDPKRAGESIAALSRDTATVIAGSGEVLLHLLGDKHGEGPQFHALNVMTLSLILGKALKLDETEMVDLAMGAVSHDAGKVRIPAHLLMAKARARHEEDFYRAHCQYGVELAQKSAAFSPAALAIIREHHEMADGSGWPSGTAQASQLARIVALTNRYDRLCCPESPDRPPLMPSEALAFLFTREAKQHDARLLTLLIKLLGVYPPGTIVQLNDGALGLVVSPSKESLRPKVLVYDPDLPKEEAPVINLAEEAADLKIEEALKPTSLPADVTDWLNPRQRLSYFFSVDSLSAS